MYFSLFKPQNWRKRSAEARRRNARCCYTGERKRDAKNLRRAMLSCAGCTLMLLVTCGLACNVFSAAQPYILAENGFTNTQTSLITTIRSAAYLLGTLAVGRYYRRIGYRAGCAAGSCAGLRQLPAVCGGKEPRGLLFCRSCRRRRLCVWLDGPGVDFDAPLVPLALRAGHRDLLRRNRTGDRRVFAAVYRHCRIQRR